MKEHPAIVLTFIKLSFVIKFFVLSVFEWPFYTGFTVKIYLVLLNKFPNFPDKHTLGSFFLEW